jgi:hypothetical protein
MEIEGKLVANQLACNGVTKEKTSFFFVDLRMCKKSSTFAGILDL